MNSNLDPYGLAEYTAQSATQEATKPKRDPSRDVRGNEVLAPRGIPTQAEADAISGVTR